MGSAHHSKNDWWVVTKLRFTRYLNATLENALFILRAEHLCGSDFVLQFGIDLVNVHLRC